MALFRTVLKNVHPLRLCSVSSQRHHNHDSSTIVKQPDEKYDIVIAGGGMVGCTLACAIAKNPILSNLKVLILEGSSEAPKFSQSSDYSNRVVALNNNTKELLDSIGAWSFIKSSRIGTVKTMQVWDACTDAKITFDDSDISMDVANIVENNLLIYAVNKALSDADNDNVEIEYNARLSKCDISGKEKLVELENGEVFGCKLFVGADGANSLARKAMGCEYVSWNYDQMGVVATLKLAESNENTTAYQRFLPTGPVALLPLNDDTSSLVWSTTTDHAKHLLSLSSESFVDAVNDAFWKKFPKNNLVDSILASTNNVCEQMGILKRSHDQKIDHIPNVADMVERSRGAFPLGFGHSARYVGDGVALVGDAAHRVHPLAGQGVNLGFGDVKDFVQLLAKNIHNGQPIANERWLLDYESRRQRHNVATQLAIETLHRIYTTDLPPVILLRTLGLQVTNAIQPLKRAIMSHATM